ncbi:MAG: DUF3883 domain-containing protein [Saprospiraceae bacterium]|nr:DUF3883 domain-containing protein [Saprospiraceae bacterium]
MENATFTFTDFSAKFKNELSKINSFKYKLRHYSILVTSYILLLFLFSVISIFSISILVDLENIKWSDAIILYFIFLFHVVIIAYSYFNISIFNFLIQLFNNGNELQGLTNQKYRIKKTMENLEYTKNLIEENDINLKLDAKSRIEALLANYFENEYLNDTYNQKYKGVIKEVEEILVEQTNEIQRNLPAIIPILIEKPTPSHVIENIEVPEQHTTLNDVFYDNSIIHKIYDAEEIFALCSDMINKTNEGKTMNGKFTSNRDYVKEYLRNLEIGKRGEVFVMHFERKRLSDNGQKEYIEEIEHVSVKYGDNYGYDILSFDEDGNEMYIEVKTTTSNIEAEFYLSKNEYEKLINNHNYYIYRVFDFDCEKFEGMIYQIDGISFNNHFGKAPKEYKVRVL